MSEEVLLAAADLALVQRLTRERDALAIQVKALSEQAAELQADRDHWTLAARAAQQRERTAAQAYQQQQTSYRELETLYQAAIERAAQAERALHELRRTIIRMRKGGHELPGSLFDASFAWEEDNQ